ncbi:hypothetical protein H4Q26_004371 [Puccinia striiformis f. sp. tritici PST-130]|nr:hypothetical protein H4Q26_004371 [Puccinia striiformis f. sp. tritici PST-130]
MTPMSAMYRLVDLRKFGRSIEYKLQVFTSDGQIPEHPAAIQDGSSSSVTLAISQAPSFTHANSLAVRQGTVDLQALKGAPLGRRNLPDIGLYSFHGAGGKREQGGYGSTVVVGSEKAVDPWGNDHYSLGEGKFDLGPGAHHSLSEGALDPGHESYGGSDSGAAISPQADASKQRKAAQKEADEATKHSKKNQEGSTSYGAQVEPTGEKKNAGDQSYRSTPYN